MQLTLDFEAGFAERFESCREFIGARVHQQGRPHKAIAADMDLSPSNLTRKLAQADTARFTLDDLEKYVRVTGDTKPIYYLIEKYLAKTDEAALLKQIAQLEAQLKGKRR